jgi:hypothetical protein
MYLISPSDLNQEYVVQTRSVAQVVAQWRGAGLRQASIAAEQSRAAEASAEQTEMRARLDRAAAEERARLARDSAPLFGLLASRSRDLVGGAVDHERGSALLRFTDLDVVVASDDVTELELLVRMAPTRPVHLAFARHTPGGPFALSFRLDDWSLTVRADALLAAR